MENEIETRDLQRIQGHTTGTIWSAHLQHSCDLSDLQVALSLGTNSTVRAHRSCVCLARLTSRAGLLAAPSQGEVGDEPLALAEESNDEKRCRH